MAERVTIQDIADSLGVSRNTVSKAINNTGVLAESTKLRILQRAKEMGYKQFSYVSIEEAVAPQAKQGGEIALLSTRILGNSHFASTMLDKIQRELTQLGYILTMHRIQEEDLSAQSLPPSVDLERTDGMICLETFHLEYARMLCSLDIPTLFVDTPANSALKSDCLYMDNFTNIQALVREMVRRGKPRIGFIGEYMHCQSFFERYMALRQAMFLLGVPVEEAYCIVGNGENPSLGATENYRGYLLEKIRSLKALPDVFLCANDFVAIDALQVFRKLGITVPGDVYLCGFDDSPESKIVTPTLTTIHIHSQIMGYSAVQLLMSRIREPTLNYRTVHTETSLVCRESTGD